MQIAPGNREGGRMTVRSIILFIVVVTLTTTLGACGNSEESKPKAQLEPAPKLVTLDDLERVSVVATSDGGAYVHSEYEQGLWYVRGTEAVRVKEVAKFTEPTTQASAPDPFIGAKLEK
jgi:hypothetical protein